jgi:hypothetical protein
MNDFPGSDDERMRRLLDEAVSDVEPRDSLDSIRSRTQVSPMRARRPWILGAGAAVVATAATVAAVAVMGGNPGTTNAQDPGFAGSPTEQGTGGPSEPSDSVPGTSPTPTDSGSAGADTVTAPVYYVGETSRGPRLFREFHQVDDDDSLSASLGAAVGEATEDGTPRRPLDPDYSTDWPALTAAEGNFDGDLITVNLGGDPEGSLRERPAGMSAEEAEIAVQQLVYTAQAATQSRAPVQFLLYGKRTDMVLGVPTAEPLSQGDPNTVLAQVWIIDPAEGAQVRVPFEVSGLANAFEANVQWELTQGDTVVRDGYTMAEEAFTMAPYSFMVKNIPPGDYTLVVHDEDASGGAEGPGVWTDTKNITVVE